MVNRVYKLKFEKSSFALNDDYERLSDIDKERIDDLNSDASFDFEDDVDNKYTCFIISKSIEMKFYLSILDNNNIEYRIKDMSDDILLNNINIEDELGYLINTSNSIRYSTFIDILDKWIYNNLDMDSVLDRISKVGMNRLRDIEKKFLNNYTV